MQSRRSSTSNQSFPSCHTHNSSFTFMLNYSKFEARSKPHSQRSGCVLQHHLPLTLWVLYKLRLHLPPRQVQVTPEKEESWKQTEVKLLPLAPSDRSSGSVAVNQDLLWIAFIQNHVYRLQVNGGVQIYQFPRTSVDGFVSSPSVMYGLIQNTLPASVCEDSCKAVKTLPSSLPHCKTLQRLRTTQEW